MTKTKLSLYVATFLLFCVATYLVEYPKIAAFNDGLLHIYFLDVGQGDSELIKTPSKKLILIDAGPKTNVSDAVSSELPFNINKIDLIIISHSHADHINGMLDVLANYDIGCVLYDKQDKSETEVETSLRSELKNQQIKVITTTDLNQKNEMASDCFSDSDVALDIYSLRNIGDLNEAELKNDQNLESNIVLLKYKNFETLFAGDAEIEVQEELTPLLNGDIEVLKAAHHGSNNGFYAPLIEKLKPNFSVISVGANNKYGHPGDETLSGYQERGLKYARTDLNGTVEVYSNGEIWHYKLSK
jgi:competence protein ComEC